MAFLTWTTFLAIYLGFMALSHFGVSFRYMNVVLGVSAGVTALLLVLGI